jgi:hypothetical protein
VLDVEVVNDYSYWDYWEYPEFELDGAEISRCITNYVRVSHGEEPVPEWEETEYETLMVAYESIHNKMTRMRTLDPDEVQAFIKLADEIHRVVKRR